MDGKSTTRLEIGKIAARCPNCKGCEFLPAPAGAEGLVCAGCGTETPRRVLVQEIARDAIERADALLRTRRKPP